MAAGVNPSHNYCRKGPFAGDRFGSMAEVGYDIRTFWS
jgi:hypothetical protein